MARVLLFLFLLAVPAAARQYDGGIRLLYDSLAHAALDEGASAVLDNTLLIRGGQEIFLTSGRLRLMKPVRGKVRGALFTGSGTFTLYLPTQIERAEFKRQTEYDLADGRHVFNFEKAVFWFEESFLADLGGGVHFASSEVSREEETAVERSVKYATDRSNDNMLNRLIAEGFEPAPVPFLFAHFFIEGKREIFLRFDPRRFEETVVQIPPFESVTGAVFWLRTLNSFHTLEEYASSSEYDLTAEDKRRYEVASTTVDVTFDKKGYTTGSALLRVKPKTPGQTTLQFMLDGTLAIDSIRTESGERVEFQRAEKAWDGVLLLPHPESLATALRFYYRGEFLKRGVWYGWVGGNVFELSSSMGWYPSLPNLDRTLFDATFHYPKELRLVPAGSIVEESAGDALSMTRSRSDGPAMNFSFTLGDMEKDTIRLAPDQPLVTLYHGSDKETERELKNLAYSYRLFAALFGSPGSPELRATPGPALHGEAFQEFVHLPVVEDFVGEKGLGVAIGHAHEVAHTWWGLGVGPRSYHDWWIGEAFAEYSALLYAPFVLNKEKPFYEKLKAWRQEISEKRKYAMGKGPELGSIWLGYRASSERTRNDYALSTYKKGAWVLHMLRMMLLDYTTMNEDAFKAMMQEFYQTYRGRDVSTEDFRRVVEKYVRTDMRWFFDQWIYGTEIPTLKCAKTLTKSPEGKYVLKLTVEERDVTGPFIVYLPFELKFGNDVVKRARLLVDKPVKEFIYTLDEEPKDVTFNIMESVLCKLEE